MTFKNQLAEDATNAFLNSDEFAEEITYTTYGESVSLTLNAIVNRKRIDQDNQAGGRILDRQCEIMIANDADNGVASVAKGKDRVWLPVYLGDSTSAEWVVIDILGNDNGFWHLLIQR